MQVTDYKVLGRLPDPFTFKNGEKVKNTADWRARRAELYEDVITLQYGHQPPQPDFVRVQRTCKQALVPNAIVAYRITTGRLAHPVVYTMYVFLPADYEREKKYPVVLDGDGVYAVTNDMTNIRLFTDNGIIFARFDRTQLADDTASQQPWCDGRTGPLYECYPEYDFGALGAWAWGYSRAIDALAQMDYVDMSCIAVTGHSRGGKTAMLAGALDERIAIVNPVQTCAGSGSCYRVHMKGIPAGEEKELPSETLSDIWKNLGFWFGPRMGDYVRCEEELPFDCHMMKAMIAPRTLLMSEAADDIWGNPLGSYQTSIAAREVWKLHGCPENILWYWKPGGHSHTLEDLTMLFSVIQNKRFGTPLHENMGRLLFDAPAPIWDWKCPETE
ncbi:MAG: acetylxylan esterase [Oscillospiraceae bacterium]|nr:acetylxylan esterase [Oscillospiraceae bacterium]